MFTGLLGEKRGSGRGDGDTNNRNECFWEGWLPVGGKKRQIPHGATSKPSCTGKPGTGFLSELLQAKSSVCLPSQAGKGSPSSLSS